MEEPKETLWTEWEDTAAYLKTPPNDELGQAVVKSQVHAVRQIVARGFHSDIEERNAAGATLLARAAVLGHPGVVRALLDDGAEVDALDLHGESPLHVAARFGHYRAAELLLGYGVEVDLPDENGITALMKASHEGHAYVAALLLENGADPERATAAGDKAMDFAATDEVRYVLRTPTAPARARRPDPEVPEPLLPGDAKNAVDEKRAERVNKLMALVMPKHKPKPYVRKQPAPKPVSEAWVGDVPPEAVEAAKVEIAERRKSIGEASAAAAERRRSIGGASSAGSAGAGEGGSPAPSPGKRSSVDGSTRPAPWAGAAPVDKRRGNVPAKMLSGSGLPPPSPGKAGPPSPAAAAARAGAAAVGDARTRRSSAPAKWA